MPVRRLLIAGATLALSGCSIAAVDYGPVRHAEYVADPRCTAQPGAVIDGAALPQFFVTTRLPDCRTDDVTLLRHRGDKVRYGRFAAPREVEVAGKKKLRTPMAFQNSADWWTALQAETDRRQGRVLLYVHGYRETFETTSKDAAQIARMTGFDGPVIEYSWPSQGEVLSYAVDETNMYHDERNFRDFLKTLAERPWVKEIVVVSHSLGARLVIPAISYVDRASSNADSSNIYERHPGVARSRCRGLPAWGRSMSMGGGAPGREQSAHHSLCVARRQGAGRVAALTAIRVSARPFASIRSRPPT